MGAPAKLLAAAKPSHPKSDSFAYLELVSESLMSQVYLAWDERERNKAIKTPVIVKRIHPNILSQTGYRKLFAKELQLTSALNHPNIVRVLESGNDQGFPYFVLEFINGKSLKDIIACENLKNGKGIPFVIAQSLFFEIAKTVGYLHDHPLKTDSSKNDVKLVLHRDLTPQNIMVSEKGEVKLIDFGIAKTISDITTTHSDLVHGRAGFVSPEHLAGEKIDQRSDVFTLGCLFYEILTGNRLFSGSNEFNIMEKVKNSDRIAGKIPQLLRESDPTIPPEVALAIAQCIRQDPSRRFTSPFRLVEALFPGENCASLEARADFLRVERETYINRIFPGEFERIFQNLQNLISGVSQCEDLSSSKAITPIEEFPELDFPEPTKPLVPLAKTPVAVSLKVNTIPPTTAVSIEKPLQLVKSENIPKPDTPRPEGAPIEKTPSRWKNLWTSTLLLCAASIGLWMVIPQSTPTLIAEKVSVPLRVFPQPLRATVFVDGIPQVLENAPAPHVDLPVNRHHTIKIAADGYLAMDQTIFISPKQLDVVKNEGYSFNLQSLAPSGNFQWRSFFPVKVSITDGTHHWDSESREQSISLREGRYQVRLKWFGYFNVENLDLLILANQKTEWNLLPFRKRYGEKSR